jgi:hypothetical protein
MVTGMILRSPPTVHTRIEGWDLRRIAHEAFAMLAAMNEEDRSARRALEVARLMLGWAEYLARRDFPSAMRQSWAFAAEAMRELIPNIEAAAELERVTLH